MPAGAGTALVELLLLLTCGVQHGLRSALALWLSDVAAVLVQA